MFQKVWLNYLKNADLDDCPVLSPVMSSISSIGWGRQLVAPIIDAGYLLTEDDDFFIFEDGDKIELEDGT